MKAQWVMCPRCDTVQPVLATWHDDCGEIMVDCLFCYTGVDHYGRDCDAPYAFPKHDYSVDEPTDAEIKELFKKLGEI